MSRWLTGLNQVSNLLEQLDDQVENVVEERANAQEELGNNAGTNDVDEILAKRGFSMNSGGDLYESKEPSLALDAEKISTSNNNEEEEEEEQDNSNNVIIDDTITIAKDHPGFVVGSNSAVGINANNAEKSACLPKTTTQRQTDSHDKKVESEEIPKDDDNDNTISGDVDLPEKGHVARLSSFSATSQKPDSSAQIPSIAEGKEGAVVSKEAVKEVRVLRRHIVKLNATLEEAEQEIMALRGELEGAAETISQGSSKVKKEREAAKKKLNEELSAQKAQFDENLKDQQRRFEEQLMTYRDKISDLEFRRKQEGGDWNKEVSQAVEREQDMSKRLTLLEDEKSILLSQISTMQSQQAALGSRLESLTDAAENSMVRERQAEDRLDSALSQHARQISQRQARETELERTIQELNSALVLARDNGKNSMTTNDDEVDESNASNLKAQIDVLRSDIATSNSQLTQERERNKALQQQLRVMSKESTQEASAVQVEHIQHQRKVADLQLTITKLEAKLRGIKKESQASVPVTQDLRNEEEQIKLLSEEVLRLRDKLGSNSSESLTLRSRLQAALERATKAEEELASAPSLGTFDVERVGEGGALRKRGKSGSSRNGSMRAAMSLHASVGERSEQIGKVVDAVDAFAASTGKYLRRNPLARAGFILYLVLVHTWTFVLLFFHAHNFENRPGDSSSAARVAIGPNALVEAHEQLLSTTSEVELLQSESTTSTGITP